MHARDELARLMLEDEADHWVCAPAAGSMKAPPPVPVSAALAFALDTPMRVREVPEFGTARVEWDVDGDGDLDVLVASAGHALLPLPWWAFLRDGDGYVPVRGGRPHPAYVASVVTATDGAIRIGSRTEPSQVVTWKP